MNNFMGIGRAVRDPDLRYIPSGTAVAKFTLAIDRQLSKEKKREAESKGQSTADFINCVAWGKTAEFIANYLTKGKLIAVQGRLQSGSYEDKDGKRVYTTDVNISNVKMLEWGEKKEMDATFDKDLHPVSNDGIPF